MNEPRDQLIDLSDVMVPEPEPEPAQEPMLWSDVAKGAARNFIPSAWQNIYDTVSIVKPENAKLLAQLAAELGMKLGQGAVAAELAPALGIASLTGGEEMQKAYQWITSDEFQADMETPLLDGVLEFYKANYGFGPDGIEGFKRFLAEDPAGFVLDVLGVASLGAGAVAKGAKLSSTLAKGSKFSARFEKFSKAASKVDEVVNKGFTLTPDSSVAVMRGIYKIVDTLSETPFVRGPLRAAWDVTKEGGRIRLGVGASELFDPGALLTGGVFRGIGKAFRAAHPNLRTKLVEQAEAEDIDLIASAKTGDKSIGSREGLAVESGNQDMIDQVNAMNEGIDAFAERIADGIGDVEDMTVAGERAIDGFRRYTSEFLDKKDELYAKWADDPKINEAPAKVDALKETLDKIAEEAKNALGDRPIPSEIQTLRTTVQEMLENIEANKVTYIDLKRKRTQIMEKMGDRTDPIVNQNIRWYSMIKHALTKAMDDTIIEVAPELKPLIEEADRFYAEGIRKINSAWGKRIFKAAGTLRDNKFFRQWEMDVDLTEVPDANPEGLMRAVFSPDTSATQIPLIYEMVGGFDSDAGRAMRAYFVRRLFNNARKTAGEVATEAGDVLWKPQALINDIAKYDNRGMQKLEAFLGAENSNKLRIISEIIASTGAFQRKATGSRTAPLLFASVGLGSILDDIGNMIFYGQAIEPLPIVIAGAVGGTALLGRREWENWLNTKAGQNYLVNGIDRNAAGRFLSKISHLQHSATWHKIYMFANRPLREMMREAEGENRRRQLRVQ